MADQAPVSEAKLVKAVGKEGAINLSAVKHLEFTGFDDYSAKLGKPKLLQGTLADKLGFDETWVRQPVDINMSFGTKDMPVLRTGLAMSVGDDELLTDGVNLEVPGNIPEKFRQFYPTITVRFKVPKASVVGYQEAFQPKIREALADVIFAALNDNLVTDGDLNDMRMIVVIGLPLPEIVEFPDAVRELLNTQIAPPHRDFSPAPDSATPIEKARAEVEHRSTLNEDMHILAQAYFNPFGTHVADKLSNLPRDDQGRPDEGEPFDAALREMVVHGRKQVAKRLCDPEFADHLKSLTGQAANQVFKVGTANLKNIAYGYRDAAQFIIEARKRANAEKGRLALEAAK